ncbi:hypothetical protein GGD66_006580 [Bradyrhizobium sp. CIR48]|uniref:hypothetical protein n=1 Tax=Bradyrhizobium sp. CIR48 TaxID=2663840 RepID=UPI0016069670|nr:hypothetical protein [Bradyrhizobium sp. CIR48]MBB4427994.1 hypothetical protein [Bradyrhizobium sp. CIR48]
MTAISAFKSADAVHFFSDGAWHDPATGKLAGIGTKVSILPQYNSLFAVTGISVVPTLLSALLIETPFVDLRSLSDAMPNLARTCVDRGRAVGHILSGRCDVVLAGWSAEAGPLIHVTECHIDHGLFNGRAVKQYIQPRVDGSAEMRFPEDGLRLLEEQYAAKLSRPDAGTFGSVTVGGLVGGFAQHTQVEADGIRIKVLKRWPDEIVGGGPA